MNNDKLLNLHYTDSGDRSVGIESMQVDVSTNVYASSYSMDELLDIAKGFKKFCDKYFHETGPGEVEVNCPERYIRIVIHDVSDKPDRVFITKTKQEYQRSFDIT